jgi:hypothetical protein
VAASLGWCTCGALAGLNFSKQVQIQPNNSLRKYSFIRKDLRAFWKNRAENQVVRNTPKLD